MKHQERQLLRAVLTSDLEPGAALVWVFLKYSLPQGASLAAIRQAFYQATFDVQDSIEILMEFGLIRAHGIKYRAADAPVRKDGKHWVLEDGGVISQDVAIDALKAQYDLWREDNGYHPWPHKNNDRAKWKDVYSFVTEHQVDLREFLDVCRHSLDGWADNPVPSPGTLASDFFQQKFLTRSDWLKSKKSKKQTAHAGAEYRPAKSIRRKLSQAGFEVTTEQARYLDDLATAVREDSGVAVPSKWRKAVQFLAGV